MNAHPDTDADKIQWMGTYFRDLQRRISSAIEGVDGQAQFVRDEWEKENTESSAGLEGRGVTLMLENGAVFERAGVGFSHVHGKRLPPAATQKRPELTGAAFEAMGLSLVFHPLNPHVPTVHMNVRSITAQPLDGSAAVSWFGGGMDLTPYYPVRADVQHFHRTCQQALQGFGEDKYPRFKAGCDAYFFLKHRNEARGVGGIFFDDFAELGWADSFSMVQAVGNALLPAYIPIVEARKEMAWGERERQFQLYRRGRYVEFNLVLDRGTHFGLQSGGRTESILLSMPPLAKWEYQKDWSQVWGTDSPEARLTSDYLKPQDWLQQT